MAKILVKLTTFIIVAVSLTMLATISSCVTSNYSSQTGDKMTAVRRIFPSAVYITETSQGARISGRSDDVKISEIKDDSGLLGYCIESKVVSRSGPFRIRVLLNPQLYVKRASVISYPWDRGRDVCKRAFTKQFDGKGPEDPIQLGNDIDAMTGATISSRVMTEGVRNTIKLIKTSANQQRRHQRTEREQIESELHGDYQHKEEQFKQKADELKVVKIAYDKETNGVEALYRKNCSSCHSLIEPRSLDKSTWKLYIDKYGQEMTNRETQLLLDYLTGAESTESILTMQ